MTSLSDPVTAATIIDTQVGNLWQASSDAATPFPSCRAFHLCFHSIHSRNRKHCFLGNSSLAKRQTEIDSRDDRERKAWYGDGSGASRGAFHAIAGRCSAAVPESLRQRGEGEPYKAVYVRPPAKARLKPG